MAFAAFLLHTFNMKAQFEKQARILTYFVALRRQLAEMSLFVPR